MNPGNNESLWVENFGTSKIETAESDTVEKSPDGRYLRFNELLGRGAFKNVYKGFDEIDGIEVAWNQISIEDGLQSAEHMKRLHYEVYLLKTLKHENVIRSYAWWIDDKNKSINIITELFTSGNLRQYRKKHKKVDMKAIKNWARQILRGLDYLHTHNPPIIHRDLKCDNIFVNGNHGEVKIGDLGLATIMQESAARSVIGTPEFMAPELYEEEYNEAVDIYSFGMCMLELVTCEYPYSECKNPAQIYKKVTSGIKPAALGKINDPEVRSFIEKCLVPASERLTAAELLNMPFLSCEYPSDCSLVQPPDNAPSSKNSSKLDSPSMDLDPSGKMLSGSPCESMVEASMSGLELHRSNERYEFSLKGAKSDDSSISCTLRIADCSGRVRNVHFEFILNADTPSSIAVEMVETLDLCQLDVDLIAELINSMVTQLVPGSGSSGSAHTEMYIESGVTNNGGPMLSSSQLQVDPSASNSALKNDGGSVAMVESGWSSITSLAGSCVTATIDVGLSISSLSHTNNENELLDDLKMELDEINLQYQERCRELLKMREVAIENAKRKWFMKKICVL